MSLNTIALSFLKNSRYLSLATADGNLPWSTPLYFACDKNFNVFFISRNDTRHSQNIYKNANVSFCIFNSEETSFTAQALYAEGICKEISVSELIPAMTCIFQKKHPELKDLKQFLNIKNFSGLVKDRIYKIELTHVYVLDPNNPDMDTRVEVRLADESEA